MIMKTHTLLFNILFSNQKLSISGVFRDFQYAKISLGKLWKPRKLLNFLAISALVSYKPDYYEEKVLMFFCKNLQSVLYYFETF